MALDLDKLMIAALAGDRTSYDQVLRRLAEIIGKYIRRRVNHLETVDDLVQEVLLRVHAFRSSWNPSLKLEPWVYTIARNTIIDYFRAHARKYAFLVPDASAAEAVELETPEATILLNEAFSQLSDDQADILTMAKLEGLSLEEIASRSGLKLSAVKVRVHRAMKALIGKISSDSSDS